MADEASGIGETVALEAYMLYSERRKASKTLPEMQIFQMESPFKKRNRMQILRIQVAV